MLKNDATELINQIHAYRAAELERVLQEHACCFYQKELLESGSGSGFQLPILGSVCCSTVGVEICGSWYREHRIAQILEYDGRSIPFPDGSFDVIFSSHVLQFLTDEQPLYDEMRRVLRPGGVAIHVV